MPDTKLDDVKVVDTTAMNSGMVHDSETRA